MGFVIANPMCSCQIATRWLGSKLKEPAYTERYVRGCGRSERELIPFLLPYWTGDGCFVTRKNHSEEQCYFNFVLQIGILYGL